METKNSKMFEEFFRDALKEHEVPYNGADWNVFEKKLESTVKKNFYKKVKYTSFGIAIVALLATLTYFYSIPEKSENKPIEITFPVEPIKNSYNASENDAYNNTPAESTKRTVSKHMPTEHAHTKTNNALPIDSETLLSTTDINPADNKHNDNDNNNEPVSNSINNNEIKSISKLHIAVNKMVVCADEDVLFFPSITNPNFDYFWDFGNGIKTSKINPTIAFNTHGEYDVTLSVKQNEVLYSASIKITVNPNPKADFQFDIVQEGLAYPQVIFTDKSEDVLYWQWDFGDSKISYEQNPLHVYFINSDKKINVSLNAMNVHGCKSKVERMLEFSNIFDLMAPNAFSPDGDGLNDYFIPKALELYDIPFEMIIYDRAGTIVYNTKNKSYPWDGRIAQTGFIPESGTFVWIVIIKDKNNNNVKYSGTVSIIK